MNNKILPDKKTRRTQNANHVSRIIGQLNALKRLMETDGSCFEIANLALTVRGSVNSLSMRILGEDEKQNEAKIEKLQKILNLYR
jgi:DNA-binding FrmR family transcriptional regulator